MGDDVEVAQGDLGAMIIRGLDLYLSCKRGMRCACLALAVQREIHSPHLRTKCPFGAAGACYENCKDNTHTHTALPPLP